MTQDIQEIPHPVADTGGAAHGNDSSNASQRSMGDILLATGRLQQPDLERILQRQREAGVAFGQAALALNLLSQADIDFALNKQFDYAYLSETDASLRPELVAAYKPFSKVGESLRAVRSQLMLRWFNKATRQRVLAIVSPASGEGRSFIAANLAIVFAQQGQRTLLIDANLRSSSEASLGALFRLGRSPGLSAILAERAGLELAQGVAGLPNLTVLPTGALPPNPQELLGRASFGQLLARAAERFDVVLIDTPAGDEFADAEIVAARVGAAVMVARLHASLIAQTSAMARRLQDSGVALVGSVLNEK